MSQFLHSIFESCVIDLNLFKQVNSSGVMPIIFSTSSLALPGTLARFTGLSALKNAAVALNPGGNFLTFLIHYYIEAQTTLYLKSCWLYLQHLLLFYITDFLFVTLGLISAL